MGVRRKVLIVSLTRLGDLIQEGPLIRILRKKLSPVEIHVITSRNFSETVNYIPTVDRTIEINYEDLIRMPLLEAYRALKDTLLSLRNENYQMVINLTPSFKERYISYFVGGKRVLGPSIKKDGTLLNSTPWTDYLYAVIIDKTFNDFNLCDLFIKIAGFEPEGKGVEFNPREEHHKKAHELLKAPQGKPIVAFQLGASTEDRIWPPESFGVLGRYLQDQLNAHIVLLGVKEERHLGERAKRLLNPQKTTDLVGKTDLGTLGAVLKRCNLLVTNDTGTMHVSAGVGTKTIALFLSSARFRDTGPYAQDHIALQPDLECSPCPPKNHCKNLRCHRIITPEAVFYIAKAVLQGRKIEPSPILHGVQVYRSTFDDEGYLRFFPAFRRPITRMELILLASRRVWRAVLDRRILDHSFFDENALKVMREMEGFFSGGRPDWEELLEPLSELEVEVGRLEEVTEGLVKAEILRDRCMVEKLGKNLLNTVESIQEKSVKERFLQPFFIMLQFAFENMDMDGNLASDLWRRASELKTLIKGQKRLLETIKKLWEGYNEDPGYIGRREARA